MREYSFCAQCLLWLHPAVKPPGLTFLFCLLELCVSYFALAASPLCLLLSSQVRLDDKTLMLFFSCSPFSLAIHLEE